MPRLLPSLLALTLAAPAQPQQTGSAVTTLRTGTKLVVVDVVVTDKKHNPIHNLKVGDFTLLENNVSQTVKSFEEHTAPTPAELQKIEPMPKMPIGIFTNFTPAPALANGPVNVLLIDRLNTPMEHQTRLRMQLMDYLKQAKPGTRIAIFGLTTRLVLLQGFTDDPALLRTVLDRKSNAKASPLQDAAVAGGGAPKTMSDSINQADNTNPQLELLAAYAKLLETEVDSHQLMDRARRTLEAMNVVGRYLAGIPGRKNLIWFSGSFPLDILPDPKLAETFADLHTTANTIDGTHPDFFNVADSNAEYRETVSLFSRAQVAVYPVDVRGVTVLPTTTVAGEGSDGDKYLPPVRGVGHRSGSELLTQDIDTAMEQTFEENNTMRNMAYQTGGQAFLNTNDLTQAVANAIDNGANYYTLTYTPVDAVWKGDFRKIEVRLQQQRLNLSYRRGYYADDPDAPPSTLAKEASGRAVTAPVLPQPNFGAMHLALMHGGPDPTQIVFTVQVLPIGNTTEDALAPRNEGSAYLKPPYRRYSLNFAADARGITFTRSADGMRHGAIEFVAFVYDADGALINAIGTPVNADFNSALYLKALQHGIPFHEEVSVPARGEYFVRVVVHDLQGDHVGAVEVPISSVRNLPPIISAHATAAR